MPLPSLVLQYVLTLPKSATVVSVGSGCSTWRSGGLVRFGVLVLCVEDEVEEGEEGEEEVTCSAGGDEEPVEQLI